MATMLSDMNRAQQAAEEIRARFPGPPAELVVVLGSGLGRLAESLENADSEPYDGFAGFPVTAVEGHAGRFWSGQVASRRVWLLQGRVHLYEGYSPGQVVHGVRAAVLAGAKTVLLTNAAGGCDPSYRPGDFMLFTDHLNLTGANPLEGNNRDDLGPRFPDLTDLYAPHLRAIASRVANETGHRVHQGVYVGVRGPSYETPAEVRMMRGFGASAVGMSTVLEAIAARHLGAELLALSCITNPAAGLSRSELTHEEVGEVAANSWKTLRDLLEGLVPELEMA